MQPNSRIQGYQPTSRVSAITIAMSLIDHDDPNYTYDDPRMTYDGIFGYDIGVTPISRVKSTVLNTRAE